MIGQRWDLEVDQSLTPGENWSQDMHGNGLIGMVNCTRGREAIILSFRGLVSLMCQISLSVALVGITG